MSYIGKSPTPAPLSSADIGTGILDSYSGDITGTNVTLTGYLRGPSSFVIDPAAHGDDTGTVVIAGNLQVDGTQTIINSTTMTVDDLNIVLAQGAADAATADGAGITVDGASATMTYSSANDEWQFNKPIAGTYQGLHPVVGTITTAIDMNKPFMTVTLSAATTFTATSMAEGRVSILKFKPASYTPTWPSEINWANETEPTWGDYNTWVISLVCDSNSDILASATGHTI